MELLLLLLFPLAWPFVAKMIWQHTITWLEMGVQILSCCLIVAIVYGIGSFSQTVDTEIWSGHVISKHRVHDEYTRSYDCNCYDSCSGTGNNRTCTRVCQTCYEDRYTVDWFAKTSLGKITFESLDRSSRSVYDTPDPAAYRRCKEGEPVAQLRNYTNYVQAVPQSLFNDNSKLSEQYAGKIPNQPKAIHSFYKINRVMCVGCKIDKTVINKINNQLGVDLITLGPRKQANINVILTEIDDPTYRYAVENAWLGGEKNEITVFVGLDGTTITWVDVMTWALNQGNELFHIKLRDGIKALDTLDDQQKFNSTIATLISKHYDRPQMADFEYLKDEIRPPGWVIVVALILGFLSSIVLTVVFQRIDLASKFK